MAKTTTAVSIRGDKDITTRLTILAAKRKTIVADLVRYAVDKEYGVDLADIDLNSVESTGTKIDQLVEIRTSKKK